MSRSSRSLRGRKQIDHVFAARLKVTTPVLTCYYVNNGLTHCRIGFVIKKRDFPRAVTRNRVRRILRETFRLQHATLTGFDALDIVVIARPDLCRNPKDTWTALANRCWQKLGDALKKRL